MQSMISKIKKLNLTSWILIGMIGGVIIGNFFPNFIPVIAPFQKLFLNGIKCAIAPLIFSTLVTGIASVESPKQLKSMGISTFIYFEVMTILALFIGFFTVNFLKPGYGIPLITTTCNTLSTIPPTKPSLNQFIEHLLPTNFADAMVRGDILQIVIFSILFASSLLAIKEKAEPILAFSNALAEIMFKFVYFIMYLAPLGICGSIAVAVADHGLSIFIPLLKLLGSIYFALILFIFCAILPTFYFFKISFKSFFKTLKEPLFLAFITTSSESAYPLALERLERFGVPKRISRFVLPMGYSFNLDGSTLYLLLCTVFLAQNAGLNLSFNQQFFIALTLMLTSKGIAAVPRTSIVVLSGTLNTFGIPLDGIHLLLGIDTFIDMGRSAVNLLSNCVAAVVVARTEGIQFKSRKN